MNSTVSHEPPNALDDAARAAWIRILPRLEQEGEPTQAQLALLTAYCVSWSRWMAAEAKLNETGAVVRLPNGFHAKSPWLDVSRSALRDMRSCLADLGLSPRKRRAAKHGDDEEDDGFGGFGDD